MSAPGAAWVNEEAFFAGCGTTTCANIKTWTEEELNVNVNEELTLNKTTSVGLYIGYTWSNDALNRLANRHFVNNWLSIITKPGNIITVARLGG